MLLGVDVGGTFTDAVLAIDGRLITAKTPTTPGDQSEGVIAAIAAAAFVGAHGGVHRSDRARSPESPRALPAVCLAPCPADRARTEVRRARADDPRRSAARAERRRCGAARRRDWRGRTRR